MKRVATTPHNARPPWLRACATGIPFFAALLATSAAQAYHAADHLVISEVAFDTTRDGTSESSEYIEIHNPTDDTIILNEGATPGSASSAGSYFLSDAPHDYFKVVNGTVSLGTTSDLIIQFPQGTTIPPHGTIVVCGDSSGFLTEMFGTDDLSKFTGQPGHPQLFETKQDDDDVPNMIYYSGGSSPSPLSLTNGGEAAILFYWDGSSDLIADVDIVVWKNAGQVVDKDVDAVSGIDGPDADDAVSYYQPDAGQTSSLAGSVPQSNLYSLQRWNIAEPDESDSAGNGITGHDETSESWGEGSTWVYKQFTPGVQLIGLDDGNDDGNIADALSFLSPVAVSSADGPTGTASPLDYDDDGTLTEFYIAAVDTPEDDESYDRKLDSLYFALRGSLFGEPDGDSNASFIFFDIDPGQGTGYRTFQSSGNELSDVGDTLDKEITLSGFTLDGYSGVGFDGAVGLTEASPTSDDLGGWRTFGTGGTSGSSSNFAWLGSSNDIAFASRVDDIYPQASGTTYAAEDGFEALITFQLLTGSPDQIPDYIFAVAVTTVGDGSHASPNTLPESEGDALDDYPQVISEGVCFDTKSGKVVHYYEDNDGDGIGNTTRVKYCGPLEPGSGLSTESSDCDDTDANTYPGAAEVCDETDNDCDGEVDEDVQATFYEDADGDGFGDPNGSTKQGCAAPPGYVDNTSDCGDDDADIHPGADERCNGIDDNCDGSIPDNETDDDGDNIAECAGDCDDADADIHPDATERCNGIDDDCDGTVPDTEVDNDEDGIAECEGDCNDGDTTIHPDADEICDSIDNDCDSMVDEGVTTTFYEDLDGDGYGIESSTISACTVPENYADEAGDCNDGDAGIHPGADEVCDLIDNNCNDEIDEGVESTFYRDEDGDGYGSEVLTTACSAPPGYVDNADDCDDDNPQSYPGAMEECDGKDNDCDGALPDNEADQDQDGIATCEGDCDDSNPLTKPGANEQCDGQDNDCDGTLPAEESDADQDGFLACGTDCDDSNADINPSAQEVCDGVDNDCSPFTDELGDSDGDGETICDGDCDDSNADVAPSAEEVCDGLDNDCNSDTDETLDGDGDSYSVCDGDCDDSSSDVSPAGVESCNNKDDDCDGEIDEDFDVDSDGDGVPNETCGGDDCNDADADIYPGADDIPGDGIDQNCTGTDASDGDGDSYSDEAGDCDDNDPEIHPNQDEEQCNDGIDNDCDGPIDLVDPDCQGVDSDGDGLTNALEVDIGTDAFDEDTDDDGLSDGLEYYNNTNPLEKDTDNDNIPDGTEDRNQDGKVDGDESDPRMSDTDGDGLTDDEEDVNLNGIQDQGETAAYLADTDGDGLSDGDEIDVHGTDPLAPDTDDDGLSDYEEVSVYNTDPNQADTDEGGVEDGQEIEDSTNPNDPSDDLVQETPPPTPTDEPDTPTPVEETETPIPEDISPSPNEETTPPEETPEPSIESSSFEADEGGCGGCTSSSGGQPLSKEALVLGLMTFALVRRRR